jgi:hypothetical protein
MHRCHARNRDIMSTIKELIYCCPYNLRVHRYFMIDSGEDSTQRNSIISETHIMDTDYDIKKDSLGFMNSYSMLHSPLSYYFN